MAIDEGAFREAFAAEYDDLTRFVRRRSDPEHAEDVVEEAFVVLWQQRTMPDPVRPWLFATARNLMLNADRGRRRRDGLAVRIAGHLDLEPVDRTGDADLRMDVIAAWRTLAPADQEVLALAVWEDLPAAEAAQVLGCSRTAYLMRLSRARARLKPLLPHPSARLTATV
ncbi:RNA polymerase sigma factor [Amnibacterium setariae]|uniref:Sigma-70 family RNA polymerase sigma factor n=1 Tax=Amnibacterium setariae TaxID=2306585 RepID=A0A3A1TWG1_9MICO|nr:sigma-70 family RNA polymerase sigma factor [Amnibacterium setariae]RIX28583.1 sigma-70 family RNA polymerase sigma factor [Amnibacterium setariae]